MKPRELEEIIGWSDISYLEVLAKAVLLDKVYYTHDRQIKVKAFDGDE